MAIDINIKAQPDDETCGPTSLHALYAYYGHRVTLQNVINSVKRVNNGGTLAPLLGLDALSRKFKATLYVYNLDLFDLSWFACNGDSNVDLCEKLTLQCQYASSKKYIETSNAYINFIKKGGLIKFKDLSATFLKQKFMEKIPILTGLSATYLYQSKREFQTRSGNLIYDDIRGEPCGHFVILCGYDEKKRHVVVADPHRENPFSNDNYYKVSINRLINAIMLGVLTFDADLLIIER